MTDDDKKTYKELLIEHAQFVFQDNEYAAICTMDCEKCAIRKYDNDMSTICPSLVVGDDIEHELILSLKPDYPEYFI
ncbi:MAG: hypothetical protein PVF17_05915 [Ignavibacteria bacterium]|jgi:hypothetical protein